MSLFFFLVPDYLRSAGLRFQFFPFWFFFSGPAMFEGTCGAGPFLFPFVLLMREKKRREKRRKEILPLFFPPKEIFPPTSVEKEGGYEKMCLFPLLPSIYIFGIRISGLCEHEMTSPFLRPPYRKRKE